ncbi:hypothetical protein HYV86_03855 [Candidatus Woesearchaeota archaeon]|nr:hypothetical protein [Candidatus Woesearchaeota archaeon]
MVKTKHTSSHARSYRGSYVSSTAWKIMVLGVLFLLVNTTLVSALEISHVRAENVTQDSAILAWETDEAANSFVEFGTDPAEFVRRGDADEVIEHRLPLSGLSSQTTYQYKVQSGDVVDDAQGSYYSFQTAAQDLSTSGVVVVLPEVIQGTSLSFNGTAENGASVRVLVNGRLGASTQAVGASSGVTDGEFKVSGITLDAEKENLIFIEATDAFGNKANTTTVVFADTHKPVVQLIPIEEFANENRIVLNGTISENSSVEIFVNNRSVAQSPPTTFFSLEVSLQEGDNTIVVVAADRAGWQSEKQFLVKADTRAPTLRAEIEKGYQFYEGRAESSISGETEPGAKVYLYIYRPQGYEFHPDFSRAVKVVEADQNGSFRFKDVDFSLSLRDQLTAKKLTPREVPIQLLEYTIFPIQEAVAAAQQATYHVFLIAEDESGKSISWQRTVNVNSCASGDLAFGVENMVKFQTPYALNPTLLDEGRQEIQAVFKFNYLGQGTPVLDKSGEVYERAYRIKNVRIEKACTQSMQEDEKFGLGCQLMPGSTRPLKGEEAVYATWTLIGAAEFSKKEDDFWNDFKKRQLMFPIKISIEYEEREGKAEGGEDKWSGTKTQTTCQDIGYFVDIPVDSADLIPDFIANDGVAALNWTITQLQTAREYVETAYLITGVSCIASFLGRWVSRGVRVATSRLESYFELAKPEAKAKQKGEGFDSSGKCPLKQNNLYMRETLENWYALIKADEQYKKDLPQAVVDWYEADGGLVDGPNTKAHTLDEQCDSTTTAWKFEAALDTAYRWTCDRAFCRAVPAGWTEDKTEEQINNVIQEQNACAVTGRGAPLIPLENCQERLKADSTGLTIDTKDVAKCWTKGDGSDTVFFMDPSEQVPRDEQVGVFHLRSANKLLGGLEKSERLVVYQPPGSEGLIAGRDISCQEACTDPYKGRYGGEFKTDSDLGHLGKGCYKEGKDESGITQLYDKNGKKLGTVDKTERYATGYTKDCFIESFTENKEPEFYQCVCMGKKPDASIEPSGDRSLRTAVEIGKYKPGVEEEWFYREERIFKESNGKFGTNYPTIRYYHGRDFSGAFGQDYLIDYIRGEDKQVAKVDPHAGLIESVQTMCTSGILKHMVMIESILVGLRNCLVEAKYTGLYDAGACKTWFSQNVCGLVYKGVAAMLTSCTPSNFDDIGKGGAFEDIGVVLKEGTQGMSSALQSSVNDIKSDYGNAQLNNYFQGGAQGFAQSMCMAAFGFDFPLFSEDFLLDAAYAFPTHSSVVVAPAFRELSTFNPAKETAIHNYEIGVIVMPGCKITRSQVSLECIGPEDRGFFGVDESCNGKGCDCLRASKAPEFAGEREKIIDTSMNIQGGRMFSVPIETPQRVDSHFRYDHVKVELELDPGENPELCFDKEVLSGRKGVWYQPITDVTPPGVATCTVDAVSGRYDCPELASLFGTGQAAIESPYMECYDKRNDKWVDCRTPNIFVASEHDDIRVRVNLALNGKGMCLRRTVRNLPGVPEVVGAAVIPENVQGTYLKEDVLGPVTETMFGGMSNQLEKVNGAPSNAGCPNQPNYFGSPETVQDRNEFVFSFTQVQNTLVQVTVPADASLTSTSSRNGYSITGGLLQKDGVAAMSLENANAAQFNADGFVISQVIGQPDFSAQPLQCTYRVSKRSVYATQNNWKDVQVVYELLDQDESKGCAFATQVTKQPAIGKNRHVQLVRIQRQPMAIAELGGVHDFFMQENYDRVHEIATEELQKLQGDMSNVMTLYYEILSLIMKGQKQGSIETYAVNIDNLLKYFFLRDYSGDIAAGYDKGSEETDDDDLENTDEFHKIYAYLCEVDKKFNKGVVKYCNEGKVAAAKRALADSSLCGAKGYTLPITDSVYAYKCISATEAKACKISDGVELANFQISAASAATKPILEAQCNSGGGSS